MARFILAPCLSGFIGRGSDDGYLSLAVDALRELLALYDGDPSPRIAEIRGLVSAKS